jgi:hypothetical protein
MAAGAGTMLFEPPLNVGRDTRVETSTLTTEDINVVHGQVQRWMQPGQQQGLRIPSLSSERTLSTCCFLVSGRLTEMVQQIHSLRASGVMSSHLVRAVGSATSAFRKSAGTLWTTPADNALDMPLLYPRYPTVEKGAVLVGAWFFEPSAAARADHSPTR